MDQKDPVIRMHFSLEFLRKKKSFFLILSLMILHLKKFKQSYVMNLVIGIICIMYLWLELIFSFSSCIYLDFHIWFWMPNFTMILDLIISVSLWVSHILFISWNLRYFLCKDWLAFWWGNSNTKLMNLQ